MTKAIDLPSSSPFKIPRTWSIGFAAVAAVGAIYLGSTLWRQRSAGWDVNALTVPVEEQPIAIRITASGAIQPISSVNLSPKNAGLIAELLVEQGDVVEAGQPIARMDAEDINADVARALAQVDRAAAELDEARAGNRPEEIAQARARVAQAEALEIEAEARLALALDRLERNRSLAAEGAISRDEMDGVENEVNVTQATLALQQANLQETRDALSLSQRGSRDEDIAAAEAELAEAQAQLQSARVRQADTVVRAPFTGTITQKFATVGAFVTPTTSASDAASATSTAIVALADGLEVLAEVPEVDIGQIRLGQTVEILADAYPDEVFEGQVKLIAPEAVVEQNVTSFQVRVDLVTGLDKLLSGMNVDATFIGDEVPNGLVVPTVAIVTIDGKTGVLVPEDDNKPRFQPITIGSSVGNETQILSGIEAGDRVFIDLPPDVNLENLNFGRDRDS
ncbi:efflux RND transporter periplasmic adaptor subunit [Synechococcus sp. PCC 7336]|uniref:efflux RND transporter periplasmic adaptor subunit n=1 Tax=Synechococcus sp. PCC 7336 TaxID=195250 RepID=UPI000345ED62|nr:efflux RND transporter periplasmic adaptor subunit [Synechococcus sp. PCC 7336]